jgi:hypothetical protein
MNLDELLRQTLHDDGYALPSWPDATARVRAGMARRRRRRTALACVVALTGVCLSAAVHGLPHYPTGPRPAQTSTPAPRTTPSPGQVIAWLDRPASPPPTSTGGPRTVPCAVGDLGRVTSTAQPGNSAVVITLTNVGRSPCAVDVDELWGEVGTVNRPIPTRPADPPPGSGTPAVIAPGQTALRQVTVATSCAGPITTYRNVSIGTKIHVPVPGLTLTSSCTIRLTPWYVTPAGAPPTTGRYADLVASIDVASIVEPGNDLAYVVTLTNPSGLEVDLNPCPVFTQRLGADGGTYLLNCTVSVLPAGSWIRLQMRLPVSATAPAGTTTLSWAIDTPDGPTAAAAVPITVR